MTVASTTRLATATGDGTTVAFPLAFKVNAATDLVVVTVAGTAPPVPTLRVYGTDYSVVLNADQTSAPGGTVTFTAAPAPGVVVMITTGVAPLQGANFLNAGGMYPAVIEAALDLVTMILQQLAVNAPTQYLNATLAGTSGALVGFLPVTVDGVALKLPLYAA